MKKLMYAIVIALIALALDACAKAPPQSSTGPQAGAAMINPGDRVGDFIITTGNGEDVVYVKQLHCIFERKTGTQSCLEPVGTKVNIGLGVYDDPLHGKALDELWARQTHQMTIEGRPVNLPAFGTVELNLPVVGKVRVWNVVVIADKPCRITAHSQGVLGGDPFDYTATVKFTAQ